MALVSQTITANPTEVQAFSGFERGQDTWLPRGRIVYNDSIAITAKDAGDTKQLEVRFILPAKFAYTIDQLFVSVGSSSSVDADNYSDLGKGQVSVDGSTLNRRFNFLAAGDTPDTAAGVRKTYVVTPGNFFTEVFFNKGNMAPNVRVQMNDTDGTNLSSALTCSFYASFLQYQIQQATHVRVNAPIPVHSR